MSIRQSLRWLVLASITAAPLATQATPCDATNACVTLTSIFNANGTGDLLLSFAPRSSDAFSLGLQGWSAHFFGLDDMTGITFGALSVDPTTHAMTSVGDSYNPLPPLSTYDINLIAANGWTADFSAYTQSDVSGQFAFGHPGFLNLIDIHFANGGPHGDASITGLSLGGGGTITNFGYQHGTVDFRPDTSVPEIDAGSGTAAIGVLLGMGALLFDRRGKRSAAAAQWPGSRATGMAA